MLKCPPQDRIMSPITLVVRLFGRSVGQSVSQWETSLFSKTTLVCFDFVLEKIIKDEVLDCVVVEFAIVLVNSEYF